MTSEAPLIPCPLCGGNERRPEFEALEFMLRRRTYPYVRCCACGHVFVNPPPDPRELEEFYAQVAPRLYSEYADPAGTSAEGLANSTVEQEKVELVRELGLLEPPREVLDVGFGAGGF